MIAPSEYFAIVGTVLAARMNRRFALLPGLVGANQLLLVVPRGCARSCPSCGSPIAPAAKFCNECGSAVAPFPPHTGYPARAAAQGDAVQTERRLVSVLFADLSGSPRCPSPGT